MEKITRKQVIQYAVMPGLKPRLQSLVGSGFQYIPFFIALVYQAVRLLPGNHPYVNPQNIGKFGIRHVVAEAANNLVFKLRNIDQILLFFTIMIGIIIACMQIVMVLFSVFAQPVMAQVEMPQSFAGFFLTPTENAPQDLAYIMMDLVFGIPDLFNSCVATATDCALALNANTASGDGITGLDEPWGHIARNTATGNWPFPIHDALHQMFSLYSQGLLVVATMITLYFMAMVVAETAQTGTAFGKRFNKVWAPLRIVVAFGLLIPLGNGLNSSQYIVLYAAKYGSGFATNGWNLFSLQLIGDPDAVGGPDPNSYLGQIDRLVTKPNPPEVTELLQFLYTASICYELEKSQYPEKPLIRPYLVRDPATAPSYYDVEGDINPAGDNIYLQTAAFQNSYEQVLNFADGANKVVLRFGRRNETADGGVTISSYPSKKGGVDPVCGEVGVSLLDSRIYDGGNENTRPEPAADIMQRYYWFLILEAWYDVFVGFPPGGSVIDLPEYRQNFAFHTVCQEIQYDDCADDMELPPPAYRQDLQLFYKNDMDSIIEGTPTPLQGTLPAPQGIVDAQAESDKWLNKNGELAQKGWAGAGIWYNKVAELNGTISAVVASPPTVNMWPDVMERVLQEKLQNNQAITLENRFNPEISEGGIYIGTDINGPFAKVLWNGFKYWQVDGHGTPTKNALVDTLNLLMGTEGLFNMRENPDAHPLALLVGVGRSFINAAIGNLLDSAGLAVLSASIGGSDGMASLITFVMTIITISLTAGFILFYVVPFLPFIYFFFAVGGWVKGIFEAMVGAPLWALAHIRIDGNGLPGQAAVNGYFLVFEIFLRPILIVFGLLASISIFSALVTVMNQTWDLVITNLAGYDETSSGSVTSDVIGFVRGPIDEFFFTVIYTIIVYLMAMSSFKLIDLIPNNILRWMGQSVATFNDQREDPAQGLVGSTTVGAQQGISGIGKGASGMLSGIAKGG